MTIIVYLLIVLFSVTQSATTKLFNRHSTNSALFNAMKSTASLAMFALMGIGGFTLHGPTLLFGSLYGVCLCLSMYTGYRALCLGPMALTSMLVSFSVLIPLLWGLTVGEETLTLLRAVAMLFLLGAIILTNADRMRGKEPHAAGTHRGKWLLFVAGTFLCNGACSILQKQHQTLFPKAYNTEFMFFAMLLCAAVFSVVSILRAGRTNGKATRGKWLGALSGVANGLANYLTLTLAGLENASILFPVISAGTLLGAILCGRFVFREKLRLNHYFALGLGMLAVVLLKL